MSTGRANPELRTPQGMRHGRAASLAVLLSAVLHVLIFEAIPALPIGRHRDDPTEPRYRSIQLREVERIPEDMRLESLRPAPYRPEPPERFIDFAPADQTFVQAIDRHVPGPDLPPPALTREDAALAPPGPDPQRSAWEPRQTIMQVEQKRVRDELAALPRRSIARTPRVDFALDVTLPADLLSEQDLQRLARETETTEQGGTHGGGAGGQEIPGAPPAVAPRTTAPRPTRLPEPPSPAEDVKETVEFQPLEHVLTLELWTYTPPDEPEAQYFAIQIQRRGPEILPVLPKDVLLIQDCSESMTTARLEECKQGLLRCLRNLDERDRFDVMGFRDRPSRCFDVWTNVSSVTRATATWFVSSMHARGMTDVLASLEELLASGKESGRPVQAILVTDGRPTTGYVDSTEIIDRFTRENRGQVAVFTIGGGRRANRYLIDLLGYRNRGDARLLLRGDDIPQVMEQVMAEVDRPVLAWLDYRMAGLAAADVYPHTLTHLYLDRPLMLYGRSLGPLSRAALQIVGSTEKARHDMVFVLDWNRAQAGDEELRRQWARHRVYALIGEHVQTQRPDLLDEIRQLAGRHRLDVPYDPTGAP